MRLMTAALYATRGLLGRSVRDVMQEMLKTPQRRQEGDQSRSDELISRGTHCGRLEKNGNEAIRPAHFTLLHSTSLIQEGSPTFMRN